MCVCGGGGGGAPGSLTLQNKQHFDTHSHFFKYHLWHGHSRIEGLENVKRTIGHRLVFFFFLLILCLFGEIVGFIAETSLGCLGCH